jgi:hypothetical protein
LKKSEKRQGPLVSRSDRLNGLHRSPVRTRDTVSGDAAVTASRWWPLPTWSWPYLRATSRRGRPPLLRLHSVLATFACRPNPTLPPQAPPSPRGGHRPNHRHPQPLPRAPVARSPPLPFLHELTDNRPLQPSPGPVPASTSTTPPRITSAPFQLWISPASLTPHRRSPTSAAITVASQAPMSPLSI